MMFSPDDFAHLKIPLENILSATNNFEHLCIKSDFGKTYSGQLLRSGELIEIYARRFKKKRADEFEQHFWMEIFMLSTLEHKNLVSLVGFCYENDEKIIITRRETRGSLNSFLNDPVRLTWVQRLEISLGIAQALSYIHYDESRDFSVIHLDINNVSIQLNEDWEPKFGGFIRSMKIKASERHNSFHTNTVQSAYRLGDPTYRETKIVNHKSDMYTFGILLIELLGIWTYDLVPGFVTHYREKKLDNIVNKDLWKQLDMHSFNMVAEIAYECLDEERSRRPNIDDIVPRLEKTLEVARENRLIHSSPNHLAHLRILFEDLLSTNFFYPKNVIDRPRGGFGWIYKVPPSWSNELIDITVRRLSNDEWDDEKEQQWDDEKEQQFWTEISMLSSLKHKNLASVVGFCNEVGLETIIYKHGFRGKLKKYLSNPMLLIWEKRLEVSVSVAHALSYIHYDESRDFSVIHRNINSYTILLNDDWEPELCEFQHSMKIKASERHHSFPTDSVWSRKGYTDPTYLETGSVNHKSDIYSFGIVLFELLCGRKSVIKDGDNKYLAPVAIFHYREKILDDIIDPKLRKQMDPRSLNVFAETAYECLSEEQSQRPNMDQIVSRLEKALELQLEWKNDEHSSDGAEGEETSSGHEKGSKSHPGVKPHLRKKTMSSLGYHLYSQRCFVDIKLATNNFAPEYIIRKKSVGSVYRGVMEHSKQLIDIVFARGIYQKDESQKFEMNVRMLSSLEHKNLVSVIGFCDVKDEKIIIYKTEANGSLNKYLSDLTLSWTQRLKICLGVANALSYIHYDPGRDFSVIHCNIRSSKILLDDKWEPKLSGLEHSLKTTVARRHRPVFTRDIIENVYLDPKYKKTGGMTQKSDVYSFGVVLFELLYGRSAILSDEELEEGLLSQLKKSHSDEMIDPHLRKQMDPEALKIFSETAYYCIQEERAKRPHIDQVVKRLEKAFDHQWKRENPVESTSFNRLKEKKFEHLKIGLDLINKATKNFDDAYCIGSGGFGKVYEAVLEHFDSSNSSSIEGVNKCDLPRKRSTVAIKRIHSQGGEQGFIAEIETLTTCKHDNIISLLGFCSEVNGSMILVYEHASKGSLDKYFRSSDTITNLPWVQRVKICLDIAHGLNYIHNNTDHGKQKMIHRDIKSDNILLGDNWEAKIADFGLSKFHPANQTASTIYTDDIAGTYVYIDPEYRNGSRLNKKVDIYSFGVVLLEILTGRLAYDSVYTKVNVDGIAPIARDHFKKGTIMEIVDRKIKEETDEHVFCKGPNKESLDVFLEIASRCVAETQKQRPTIEAVIKALKKALNCQENHKENLKRSFEDIKLATEDFSPDNIIGHGKFGNVYRGVVTHAHGHNIIVAKRLNRKSVAKDVEFMTELEILMEHKHENVIGLVGYCDEEDEKVIVYEYASRGSLDKYLSEDSLTWVMRLNICINIAIGLEFLHGTVSSSEIVIHRDISSSNILLFDDWKAKITGFVLSLVCPVTNQNVDYVIDDVTGTIGYLDPLHSETDFLTKESDIFSLGAVLFDILCGKQSSVELDGEYLYLPFLAKHHYQVGKLDELVFEGIKEQIEPQSFITFARIAYQCIHHRRERRPTANEVVIQLKKALEFQENYEEWEPKLPTDYKEIIQMSKCPEIYSAKKKEELYNIFSKGILLQQDNVLLSFVGNGERNKMVSAKMFSYKNSCRHAWKALPESRFGTVVEMLDISNLNIEIKTNAQLLSPNVVYGVYLVFKFCDSRNFASRPMHVDLNYRKGHEILNAYFATWRDEWMTIELYRFLNQKEDVVFEFLLECFSSYDCGDGAIYVEGIEFRAIQKVQHEEIGKLKEIQQVLKSNFEADQVQQLPCNFEEIYKISRHYDELFWLGEVHEKKLLMVSAKEALYKSSNVNFLTSTPSAQSRFQEMIELLPQKAFYINCTIKSQLLSPDTEYVCYLVFKLSEECRGLHNPVKVRDLLHQENNEAEFFYFITPSLLNIHDFTRVPKQREDGWMEIQVWKFDSTHEFKDDSLSIDMKFSSHQGPMSGLIVCGLEFRPM
ncbi:protein kinase-like domain, Phloem protein 2-like protein [Artemisia annua]|uniref:non-specific serine/threonine protein kinase n=1 Tax=Artemisia annua TaxID=35608 RepID=A0A2U1N0G0_ARTAN|nr:protein kinase-like domain, Phloem protein 2-like protein [Artemisia annua]